MSLEDAIRMIQIHERARQGRLRAKFMREIRQQEERERMVANRGAPTLDPDIAATRIQKVFTMCVMRDERKVIGGNRENVELLSNIVAILDENLLT